MHSVFVKAIKKDFKSLRLILIMAFACLDLVDVQFLKACSAQPCLYGGTCKSIGDYSYICHCRDGHTGITCEGKYPYRQMLLFRKALIKSFYRFVRYL